jgi:hypothetical protein
LVDFFKFVSSVLNLVEKRIWGSRKEIAVRREGEAKKERKAGGDEI